MLVNYIFIKTFKTSSFNGSERKLSKSVNKWLENHLFSEKETKTKNYSLLFEKLNGNNSNWWTENIKYQLDVFLSSMDIDKFNFSNELVKSKYFDFRYY